MPHANIERRQRLFKRRVGIQPVDVEQIHVVHLKALERPIDLVENVLARQALAVFALAHRKPHLGRHNDIVPAGKFFQHPTGNFFGIAMIVVICGIEEVDAALNGKSKERLGFLFRKNPWVGRSAGCAERHATQANA